LTIGHAVSVAEPHSRIAVGPGTYTEMVDITTPITLIGFNATIDASGLDQGIYIHGSDASGASVSGFTIENATFEGILVEQTSNITIQNNVVQNNDQGASSPNPTGLCAPSGEVPGDCGEAIQLLAVSHSRVVSNTVQNNVGGILLTDDEGPTFGNLIRKNTILNNDEDCGITLPSHNPAAGTDPSLAGVYNNIVIDNDSEGNGGAGIGVFAAPPGAAAYNNTIVNNTVKGNGEGGINIHSHAPDQNVSGNVITSNVISNNGQDPDSGSPGTNGISVFTAVNAQTETIAANRLSDEDIGIFISGDFTLKGLQSNHFDSSVTTPIQQ
jgi:parallel beta-helix repeat protein